MHVYAIVSLRVNNSVSYTTWRFSSKIQQSRDCLLVYVYAYSCLMPISDRASNKRTHHHHPITPKRNDHKLYISLVFCNSMYVHDCMKNLVLNIKINMMMVIICDINNSTVLVLRYCYICIACPYIPIKGYHRAIKWTWYIDIDQIYSPVFKQ